MRGMQAHYQYRVLLLSLLPEGVVGVWGGENGDNHSRARSHELRWRQLCCRQGDRQRIPSADETWALWHARLASSNPKVVESVAQIAHDPMPGTNDLSTRERLEATQRAYPPFTLRVPVLVIPFQPLLSYVEVRCATVGRTARKVAG